MISHFLNGLPASTLAPKFFTEKSPERSHYKPDCVKLSSVFPSYSKEKSEILKVIYDLDPLLTSPNASLPFPTLSHLVQPQWPSHSSLNLPVILSSKLLDREKAYLHIVLRRCTL